MHFLFLHENINFRIALDKTLFSIHLIFFLISPWKHILWVLIRSTSVRHFLRVPTTCLRRNKENICLIPTLIQTYNCRCPLEWLCYLLPPTLEPAKISIFMLPYFTNIPVQDVENIFRYCWQLAVLDKSSAKWVMPGKLKVANGCRCLFCVHVSFFYV